MANYIGVDEVGRGSIAGPLTVCAVKVNSKIKKELNGLKDSKQLTHKKRMEIFNEYKDTVDYSLESKTAKQIDKNGISKCLKELVQASVDKVATKNDNILLDGGLKVDDTYKNQQTIIKGDEKEGVIALASIIAKVSRDTLMLNLSKKDKYKVYGLDSNKGYGTKKHFESVYEHGISDIHRETFIKG